MTNKSVEVVVGTYEHFVLGYKIKKTEDVKIFFNFKLLFINFVF